MPGCDAWFHGVGSTREVCENHQSEETVKGIQHESTRVETSSRVDVGVGSIRLLLKVLNQELCVRWHARTVPAVALLKLLLA